MNTEITNETKAKVFAQYLGQPLNSGKKILLNGERLDEIATGERDSILILKPLSAITDNDAIQVTRLGNNDLGSGVVKIGNIYTDTFCKTIMLHGEHPNPFISKFYILFSGEFKSGRFPAIQVGLIYQFLQSKGYDLPNYLLGGKTLHESGLCIYETEK